MLAKNMAILSGLACALPALAQITFTQNTNPNVVIAGTSVACAAGGGTTGVQQVTTENSYWRSFNLSAISAVPAGGVTVRSIKFAAEQATHPSGTQTVTVRIYKDTNGGAPTAVGTDLLLQATGTVAIANGTSVFVTAGVVAPFAKTDTLVVEINSPDYRPFLPVASGGQSTVATGENAVFFVGANNLGQTGPSYISSTACGLNNPGDLASVGFPNDHVIMEVSDVAVGGGGCYANCDLSTNAPLLTANDFQCFLNEYAAGHSYANCDQSTNPPVLTANDFQCFLNAYAVGCS